jgi:hypothetical protein
MQYRNFSILFFLSKFSEEALDIDNEIIDDSCDEDCVPSPTELLNADLDSTCRSEFDTISSKVTKLKTNGQCHHAKNSDLLNSDPVAIPLETKEPKTNGKH